MTLDLAKLRALLESPELRGEWYARGCYIYRSSDPLDRRQVARVPGCDPPNGDQHPIARFIATARTALPQLIDEVERLRKAAEAAMIRCINTHTPNDDVELFRREAQAELEQMRPVVEAAQAWRLHRDRDIVGTAPPGGARSATGIALIDAVDDLNKARGDK